VILRFNMPRRRLDAPVWRGDPDSLAVWYGREWFLKDEERAPDYFI
jgi:hypothetical protein